MIIYRMVIVEGRCTKLQLLISYIYNHWLTQKYSESWLVRYNGLVWSNIAVTFFYHPIYMIIADNILTRNWHQWNHCQDRDEMHNTWWLSSEELVSREDDDQISQRPQPSYDKHHPSTISWELLWWTEFLDVEVYSGY